MKYPSRRAGLVFVAALSVAASVTMPGWAQRAQRSQRRSLQVEAYTGGRFGVGRIAMGLPVEMQPAVLGSETLRVEGDGDRVLYPAIQPPPLGGLFANLLRRPHPTIIYFLFRDNEPLRLTLRGRLAKTIDVTPRHDPAAAKRLLDQWWEQYSAGPKLLRQSPDYPPLVDNYLKSTLARRLSLKLPKREQTESWQDRLAEEVGLTLGTEEIRLAMQQDRILGLNHLAQVADQPLPDPMDAGPIAMETTDDVTIEPISLRVPEECFYVRFGSFENFLWARDTMGRWRGDLMNLVATRGLDYATSERMEQQLVLKQTTLTRLLGDAVIGDVALIGTDAFFHEGAAYGLLLHGKQNAVLGTSISMERSARLKAGGVAQSRVKIAGRNVSRLASADGRVRSYYAADGDYHFATTSETLMRRFLETGADKGALGRSADFRHARSLMPVARDDTVFVYLSDAFFRNFTSPHYRVELARRLQAASDIDLVRIAVLAAAAEGKPSQTIEQLIEGELLPEEFGPRPDGSRTVLEDGLVHDQLRGHGGGFVPVPDTPLTAVTSAEASAYREFADFYRENWGRLDPVAIGVKRTPLEGNRERIALDVRMSPFSAEHFALLSQWLGPPDRRRLASVTDDVVAAEFVLKNQRLFGGLSDFGLPLRIGEEGLISFGGLRDVLVGYVGTTGQLGLLNLLDLRGINPPDDEGYSSTRLGLWRRQLDDYTVFSLHREVLANVTPQLKYEDAPRPAQVRLRIGDLSQARMTPTLNDLGYRQTRETSLGNLRLLGKLAQQLHLPAKECKQAAEFLLDAELVCPLGGEYAFQENREGVGEWTSTALRPNMGPPLLGTPAPDDYQTPPLDWFRGLDLEAAMTREALSVHAELIVEGRE